MSGGSKLSFEKAEVFRHHQPFTEADMRARVIPGMDGAFREAIINEGFNPDDPQLGVLSPDHQ